MKILFLNCCGDKTIFQIGAPIFGMSAISAYLKQRGYKVKGIDLNLINKTKGEGYLDAPAEIIKEITEFNPDVCGMTCFTHTRHNVYHWARILKGINPSMKIVLGGVHASSEPVSVLKTIPEIDFIVIGEGEMTMNELCRAISHGRTDGGNLKKIDGIAFREKSEVVVNPQRAQIHDINLLPTMDRELFLTEEIVPKIRILEMMGGRGCPSQCKFCNSASFWKGGRRARSAESVIREISDALRRFPNIRFIKFRDETFFTDKDVAFKVMKQLKKIGLPWECWSRLHDLNEDIIKAMADSNCSRVRIGIESGSKRLIKDTKKYIDIDKAPAVFSMLRRYKINYSPSFILGLPGSALEDVYASLDLIRKIRVDPFSCTLSFDTFLFPGTEYFEEFKKKNPDFSWEGTPRKFRDGNCIIDRCDNYILPKVSLPRGMSAWKCQLLFIKSTFRAHPINTAKYFCLMAFLLLKKHFRVKLAGFKEGAKGIYPGIYL